MKRTKSDGDITNKWTHLSPKIALRNNSPKQRPFQSIATMQIECQVDWCLIHVKKWVRTGRKNKSDDNIKNNNTHLLTKNHITERVAASAPIQSHPYNLHSIWNRLMYRTFMKNDQIMTKRNKMATSQQSRRLTFFDHKNVLFATSRQWNSGPTFPEAITRPLHSRIT